MTFITNFLAVAGVIAGFGGSVFFLILAIHFAVDAIEDDRPSLYWWSLASLIALAAWVTLIVTAVTHFTATGPQ